MATTLRLIIEWGVDATTHRNIAEAAAVPLGSLTYYFDGLSDLFVQAFELLCARIGTALRADLEGAATVDEAMEISRRWLRTSHDSLRIHFPEHTTRALDALDERWHLHQKFTGQRAPRDLVQSAIRALVEQQKPAGDIRVPTP